MFVREKIDELIGAATLVNVSERIILSRDAKDDHCLTAFAIQEEAKSVYVLMIGKQENFCEILRRRLG